MKSTLSTYVRVAAACAITVPAIAWAHAEHGAADGFLSGLAHPVSGLDHVLAMIAVGLWGAQLGRPAIWLLPLAFPLAMAIGGVLGLIGLGLPAVEIGIAVSALVLGALIVVEGRPALPIALGVVAFFAVFHGHAHGTELPDGASALTYSFGFVMATGLLHALGIAIGLVHRWPLGRQALRGAGALVAMGGIFFLVRALGG